MPPNVRVSVSRPFRTVVALVFPAVYPNDHERYGAYDRRRADAARTPPKPSRPPGFISGSVEPST
ncbi:hypothetical protein BRC68_11115 [Halobacteriales archaeon QH_6_64_20]|nr:MAG: hypothetical protein BRC68_11115 [Halobacteriales archaeon QH_6_64_20]